MKLDNNELHEFLIRRGIPTLYHANTVSTSITYLQQKGLLSRGGVELLGLTQTKQSSDSKDKLFNVWNDIFLDTVDLHKHFLRQNLYGPVLFKFNVDCILNKDFDIWITKNNPIYWSENDSDEEKYFINIEELNQKWDNIDTQKKMITIRNNKQPILFENLNRIVIDDPSVILKSKNIHYFNEAILSIKNVLKKDTQFKNILFKRNCNNCYCEINYLHQVTVSDLKRLFLVST